MQKKKSIIAYGSLKELHAKMSLFFYAVLLRGRMQKYIFTCGPLKWLVCENTLLFSFQHFRFFSPPLLSLPLFSLCLFLSFPPLSLSLLSSSHRAGVGGATADKAAENSAAPRGSGGPQSHCRLLFSPLFPPTAGSSDSGGGGRRGWRQRARARATAVEGEGGGRGLRRRRQTSGTAAADE